MKVPAAEQKVHLHVPIVAQWRKQMRQLGIVWKNVTAHILMLFVHDYKL